MARALMNRSERIASRSVATCHVATTSTLAQGLDSYQAKCFGWTPAREEAPSS